VLLDIALVGVAVPLDAVPMFAPSRQRSDHEQEEEEAASSRVGGTPQKRDRRSSPEQVNSESDERLGGSYSPKVLCAQAMGRESNSSH
jgi:hypothetical protein